MPKQILKIGDIKFSPSNKLKGIQFYSFASDKHDGQYTNDLIETDFFVRGIVLAHFIFPTKPSFVPDTWKSVKEGLGISDEQIGKIGFSGKFSWNNTSDGIDFSQITDDPSVSSQNNRISPPINYTAWDGVQYGQTSRFKNKRGGYMPIPPVNRNECPEVIFIRDLQGDIGKDTTAIAIIGTQHYGVGYWDLNTPINVDTSYVPSRYHINVGDIIEIYSGNIVEQRQIESYDPRRSTVSKIFISLSDFPMYRIIPGISYSLANTGSKLDLDIYLDENNVLRGNESEVQINDILPEPKEVTIPRLSSVNGDQLESDLIRIKNVRLNPNIFGNKKSNFINLEPNRLYEVVDQFNNKISFRICNGTEMAINMPKIQVNSKFDLIGIVAGKTSIGEYEIWPRTMYDLGLPNQKTKVSSNTFIKTINSI